MHKQKTFSYGNYHATLYAFRGTVAEVRQNRTVHTEISGGGGMIPAAPSGLPGRIDPVRSSNTEHVHDRLFLVDEAANQETDIALTNWNFPARVGNDAAFCWLVRQGKQSGPYVYGVNYSLDREMFRNDALPIFNPLRRKSLQTFIKFSAFPIALLCGLLATDFYGCMAEQGTGMLERCFSNSVDALGHSGFGTFALYSVLGLFGGPIAVNILFNILFAGAIKKGAAAEQQMRDDIRQLCREALAEKKAGAE